VENCVIDLASQLIKYFVSHITGLKTWTLTLTYLDRRINITWLIFWLSILYLFFIKIETWILQSKSFSLDCECIK